MAKIARKPRKDFIQVRVPVELFRYFEAYKDIFHEKGWRSTASKIVDLLREAKDRALEEEWNGIVYDTAEMKLVDESGNVLACTCGSTTFVRIRIGGDVIARCHACKKNLLGPAWG